MEHTEVTLVRDSVTLRLPSQYMSSSGQLSCRTPPGQPTLKPLSLPTPVTGCGYGSISGHPLLSAEGASSLMGGRKGVLLERMDLDSSFYQENFFHWIPGHRGQT